MWRHMPLSLQPGRQRQDGQEYKASLKGHSEFEASVWPT